MPERERWMDLLQETGALQTGHFLLSSGHHSAHYVQCARVLEHPAHCAALGRALAGKLPSDVDCVLAAPLGGLLIGYEVARSLQVPLLFPERDNTGEYVLRRGFRIELGANVGVIEDVITTGRTTRELMQLVRESRGIVRCIGAIIDRSKDHLLEETRINALVPLNLPTYRPEACPLCAAGQPIAKPGSRPNPGGAK